MNRGDASVFLAFLAGLGFGAVGALFGVANRERRTAARNFRRFAGRMFWLALFVVAAGALAVGALRAGHQPVSPVSPAPSSSPG